jgi:hypothetical protein
MAQHGRPKIQDTGCDFTEIYTGKKWVFWEKGKDDEGHDKIQAFSCLQSWHILIKNSL